MRGSQDEAGGAGQDSAGKRGCGVDLIIWEGPGTGDGAALFSVTTALGGRGSGTIHSHREVTPCLALSWLQNGQGSLDRRRRGPSCTDGERTCAATGGR